MVNSCYSLFLPLRVKSADLRDGYTASACLWLEESYAKYTVVSSTERTHINQIHCSSKHRIKPAIFSTSVAMPSYPNTLVSDTKYTHTLWTHICIIPNTHFLLKHKKIANLLVFVVSRAKNKQTNKQNPSIPPTSKLPMPYLLLHAAAKKEVHRVTKDHSSFPKIILTHKCHILILYHTRPETETQWADVSLCCPPHTSSVSELSCEEP